jgi:hypothetical protein
VEEYYRVGQATDENMAHVLACWIINVTDTDSELI